MAFAPGPSTARSKTVQGRASAAKQEGPAAGAGQSGSEPVSKAAAKPTMIQMVQEAVNNSRDPRKGVSVVALKAYILEHYPNVEEKTLKTRLKRALVTCLERGLILRPSSAIAEPDDGKVLVGRYKVGKEAKKDKPKASAAPKEKKLTVKKKAISSKSADVPDEPKKAKRAPAKKKAEGKKVEVSSTKGNTVDKNPSYAKAAESTKSSTAAKTHAASSAKTASTNNATTGVNIGVGSKPSSSAAGRLTDNGAQGSKSIAAADKGNQAAAKDVPAAAKAARVAKGPAVAKPSLTSKLQELLTSSDDSDYDGANKDSQTGSFSGEDTDESGSASDDESGTSDDEESGSSREGDGNEKKNGGEESEEDDWEDDDSSDESSVSEKSKSGIANGAAAAKKDAKSKPAKAGAAATAAKTKKSYAMKSLGGVVTGMAPVNGKSPMIKKKILAYSQKLTPGKMRKSPAAKKSVEGEEAGGAAGGKKVMKKMLADMDGASATVTEKPTANGAKVGKSSSNNDPTAEKSKNAKMAPADSTNPAKAVPKQIANKKNASKSKEPALQMM